MPIRADLMPLYPGGSTRSEEWRAIQVEIRERSGNRCEGSPAYPECRAENGKPHPATGATVVLMVAHMNHDPTDNGEPGNRPMLAHWCQLCHNTFDAPKRSRNAATTRRVSRDLRTGQGWLDLDEPAP